MNLVAVSDLYFRQTVSGPVAGNDSRKPKATDVAHFPERMPYCTDNGMVAELVIEPAVALTTTL